MPTVNADLLAPRYLIKVEGTKLSEDVTRYIESVEYEEEENVASRITLRVVNDGFRFLDSKIFAEGNKVDLWMGYVGKPLHFMQRGIIVRPNPDFPRAGLPKMQITAHDETRKLMEAGEKDKGKVYKKRRDSEIAEELFKEAGFAPFTFQTKGLLTRVRKRGTTKWAFLQHLARLHNFVVWARYDPQKGVTVGYFGPPDAEDQPGKYKFVYGTGEPDATLLEFHPNMSVASQDTKITVVWTDPKTRKTHRLDVEVKKKAEKTKFVGPSGDVKLKKEIKSGPSVTLTVLGQRQEVVVGRPFRSAAEAKRFAAAWWARREREFAFGRGTVVGAPDVRRGHVHELTGLGTRLSGDWQFTGVVHRMAGKELYETEFSSRKVVLESVVGAPDSVTNVKKTETAQ